MIESSMTTEICPKDPVSIRKIHDIEDSVVRNIFTLSNLQNLDIRISSGKGGSFFIEPVDGGRMMTIRLNLGA